MTIFKKSQKDQKGAALVEVAVISPILILFLLGIVEIGTYMYQGIEVGNAAKSAVQYGSQTYTTALDTVGMRNAAVADAADISGLAISTTTYCTCTTASGAQSACASPSPCPNSGPQGLYVAATVNGNFSPILSIPGLPSQINISRAANMQVTPQ